MTGFPGDARRPVGDAVLPGAIPDLVWPAMPDDASAQLLGLLFQLEETQWWTPARLRRHALEQAAVLLEHARRNVPFYANRLPEVREPLTMGQWRTLPVVTRAELQEAGPRAFARALPAGHAPAQRIETSGSTGRPLASLNTGPMRLIDTAVSLRALFWHGFDLTACSASIRKIHGAAGVTPGGWGACFESGPHIAFDVGRPVDEQIDWLCAERPRYLLSYATALDAIARRCAERGLRLEFLERLSSFGEVLGEEVRERCRRVLGLEIIDSYSAQETGTLTTQCPVTGLHHVAAEGVLLEVLDASGRACRPGHTGRIVLTTLHNFAAPLIRYAIGDYAEAGAPCPCGRGLPVLGRIRGRSRNMLCRPDGTQVWPSFPAEMWSAVAPVRQFQLVQPSLRQIRVRYVMARPLERREECALAAALQDRLGFPFDIAFEHVPAIERSAGGKFEDFVSALAQGG